MGHDAHLAERMLHARVEALLRQAITRGVADLVGRDHQPVVLLAADGTQTTRWLRAGTDAGLIAALASEANAIAAACLLVEDRRPGAAWGSAITVSGGGARVLALDVARRRLGRPRLTAGVEEEPRGVARQVAGALQHTILRGLREQERAPAVDPPVA